MGFVGSSVLCVCTLQECFFHSLCCFVIQCSVDLFNINMDTYHAVHWSDLDFSSSDDEENRYTGRRNLPLIPKVAYLNPAIKSCCGYFC